MSEARSAAEAIEVVREVVWVDRRARRRSEHEAGVCPQRPRSQLLSGLASLVGA